MRHQNKEVATMNLRIIYSEAVEARLEELDGMLSQRGKEVTLRFINNEDMREVMTALKSDYLVKEILSEMTRLIEIAIPIKYELR